MMDFVIGDRVSFQSEGWLVLFGVLTRYKKKMVMVITDGGEHWNVFLGVLRKAGGGEKSITEGQNIIPLPRK